MSITIRQATETDAKSIAENVVLMANEGSQERLDNQTVQLGVSSLFKKPELGFYVVAEQDNKIIASLVIVYEWSDWRNGLHWWIHSVYVSPIFRKQGVYKKMYEFVKNKADKTGAKSVRLSVNKNNMTARNAYESLGMRMTDSITYSR